MGQTSNPTLRYPDGTDRPRAVQIRHLAEDTHAAIVALRNTLETPWITYTPGWFNGAGAALSIGNGSIGGRYKLIGQSCTVSIFLGRGTSTNQGDTWWGFRLPFTTSAWDYINGAGVLSRDGTQGNTVPVGVHGIGGDRVVLTPPAGGRVSNTNPGTHSAGGFLRFTVTYQVA